MQKEIACPMGEFLGHAKMETFFVELQCLLIGELAGAWYNGSTGKPVAQVKQDDADHCGKDGGV